MNILPNELLETIFEYLPLVTYKYNFRNLNKTTFKLLNIPFHLYIEKFRKKNKEWLIIELLIKEDILAIYYIINDLPKLFLINIILHSIYFKKYNIVKILLSHPLCLKFIDSLDVNFIDDPNKITYLLEN